MTRVFAAMFAGSAYTGGMLLDWPTPKVIATVGIGLIFALLSLKKD